MLPCVCSVIDHRWRQNGVRTKAFEAITKCATAREYHRILLVTDILTTFDVFCDHLLEIITEQTHGIMERLSTN